MRAVAAAAGVRAGEEPAPVRTDPVAPPVRLTRRGRMLVTGAAALAIGAASVGLGTAAQAAHTGPGRTG
ncbi:MAG TPA: hypothetical protein VHF26_02090, partial [Trebonia sp.]|nr:hypothetical protein [Trebonia sp.]